MTDSATYAANVRAKNHTINPDVHPHLDNNGISTRIMQTTGYRPTPEDLIAMIIHEAKAFTRDEYATLIEGLTDIGPELPLNS